MTDYVIVPDSFYAKETADHGWLVNQRAGRGPERQVAWFHKKEDAEQLVYVKNLIANGELDHDTIQMALKPKQRWTSLEANDMGVWDRTHSIEPGRFVIFVYDEYDDVEKTLALRDEVIDALNERLP